MKPKPDRPFAWAWEIQDDRGKWVLCRWAKPFRRYLAHETPPSPEARLVRVQLVRAREIRRGEALTLPGPRE